VVWAEAEVWAREAVQAANEGINTARVERAVDTT
jgi:hypothetical protein